MTSDSTNSNSGADDDVLTNFQPMPKRFMVFQQFGNPPDNWHEVKTCHGHEICIGLDGRLRVSGAGRDTAAEEFLINNSEIIICQSTNLFDKNGEEIFEGSIIRDEDEGYFSVVENRDGEYCGVDPYNKEVIDSISAMKSCSEVISHILSNPELLGEKNV